MDRIKAYALLAKELHRFRALPYDELCGLIGGPVFESTVEDDAGPFVIEIRVEWASTPDGPVRIRATANGPSWWRLERLEEATVVAPGSAGNEMEAHPTDA